MATGDPPASGYRHHGRRLAIATSEVVPGADRVAVTTATTALPAPPP